MVTFPKLCFKLITFPCGLGAEKSALHFAEPGALLRGGHSGACDHDEPEPSGGEGSAALAQRLPHQPQVRNYCGGPAPENRPAAG